MIAISCNYQCHLLRASDIHHSYSQTDRLAGLSAVDAVLM